MGLQVLLRKKHTHRKAISFNDFSNNTIYRHSLRLFFLKGFSVKEKDSMLKFKTNQHFFRKKWAVTPKSVVMEDMIQHAFMP